MITLKIRKEKKTYKGKIQTAEAQRKKHPNRTHSALRGGESGRCHGKYNVGVCLSWSSFPPLHTRVICVLGIGIS